MGPSEATHPMIDQPLAVISRAELARRYAQAKRHTRLVKFLRFMIRQRKK